MYFAPETAQRVVARLVDALAPGGHLFLGHAETLRGGAHPLQLCATHETFYYQRTAAREPAPDPTPSRDWLDAIDRASSRIASLVPTERAAIETTPLRDVRMEDSSVARAVQLTNSGQFEAAEAMCNDVITREPRNAAMLFLLGLCRAQQGDPNGAKERFIAASRADASFAMPRLHLGMLERRGGDRVRAQRELAHALTLLEWEDDARIALFGDGIGRAALVELCRAELRAVRG
jgi:chemotaxis protein methyltransferase CheR